VPLSVKRSQGFFTPDIFDELLPLEMGSHFFFSGRALFKEGTASWEIDRQLLGGRR
jgi:hypothetical protein